MKMDNQEEDNLPAMIWWNKRRLKYNIGLVISGFLAFIFYVIVIQLLIIPKDNNAEITLFTTLFQAIGYLIMILVANLLYFIGPISERIFNPTDKLKYRKLMFGIGFWGSVLLPFSIPILLMILNI